MTPRRAGTFALLAALGLGPVLAGTSASAGATPQRALVPTNAVMTSSLEDDFNGPAGSAPNASMWTAQTSGQVFSNGSLANYTTSPANVSLDGHGHLDITVRKSTSGGTTTYTSGFVSSNALVGPDMHIEARIKLAKGYGMWPLFWIQGIDSHGVGWPATGEVDIAENPAKLPHEQWATAHGLALSGGNTSSTSHWKSTTVLNVPTKLGSRYHTYGLDVTSNSLTWTFDGKVYKTLYKSQLQPTWMWSFNLPFEIIFNVDVGGNFPGNPKPTTKFPTTMSIDYVKVTPN